MHQDQDGKNDHAKAAPSQSHLCMSLRELRKVALAQAVQRNGRRCMATATPSSSLVAALQVEMERRRAKERDTQEMFSVEKYFGQEATESNDSKRSGMDAMEEKTCVEHAVGGVPTESNAATQTVRNIDQPSPSPRSDVHVTKRTAVDVTKLLNHPTFLRRILVADSEICQQHEDEGDEKKNNIDAVDDISNQQHRGSLTARPRVQSGMTQRTGLLTERMRKTMATPTPRTQHPTLRQLRAYQQRSTGRMDHLGARPPSYAWQQLPVLVNGQTVSNHGALMESKHVHIAVAAHNTRHRRPPHASLPKLAISKPPSTLTSRTNVTSLRFNSSSSIVHPHSNVIPHLKLDESSTSVGAARAIGSSIAAPHSARPASVVRADVGAHHRRGHTSSHNAHHESDLASFHLAAVDEMSMQIHALQAHRQDALRTLWSMDEVVTEEENVELRPSEYAMSARLATQRSHQHPAASMTPDMCVARPARTASPSPLTPTHRRPSHSQHESASSSSQAGAATTSGTPPIPTAFLPPLLSIQPTEVGYYTRAALELAAASESSPSNYTPHSSAKQKAPYGSSSPLAMLNYNGMSNNVTSSFTFPDVEDTGQTVYRLAPGPGHAYDHEASSSTPSHMHTRKHHANGEQGDDTSTRPSKRKKAKAKSSRHKNKIRANDAPSSMPSHVDTDRQQLPPSASPHDHASAAQRAHAPHLVARQSQIGSSGDLTILPVMSHADATKLIQATKGNSHGSTPMSASSSTLSLASSSPSTRSAAYAAPGSWNRALQSRGGFLQRDDNALLRHLHRTEITPKISMDNLDKRSEINLHTLRSGLEDAVAESMISSRVHRQELEQGVQEITKMVRVTESRIEEMRATSERQATLVLEQQVQPRFQQLNQQRDAFIEQQQKDAMAAETASMRRVEQTRQAHEQEDDRLRAEEERQVQEFHRSKWEKLRTTILAGAKSEATVDEIKTATTTTTSHPDPPRHRQHKLVPSDTCTDEVNPEQNREDEPARPAKLSASQPAPTPTHIRLSSPAAADPVRVSQWNNHRMLARRGILVLRLIRCGGLPMLSAADAPGPASASASSSYSYRVGTQLRFNAANLPSTIPIYTPFFRSSQHDDEHDDGSGSASGNIGSTLNIEMKFEVSNASLQKLVFVMEAIPTSEIHARRYKEIGYLNMMHAQAHTGVGGKILQPAQTTNVGPTAILGMWDNHAKSIGHKRNLVIRKGGRSVGEDEDGQAEGMHLPLHQQHHLAQSHGLFPPQYTNTRYAGYLILPILKIRESAGGIMRCRVNVERLTTNASNSNSSTSKTEGKKPHAQCQTWMEMEMRLRPIFVQKHQGGTSGKVGGSMSNSGSNSSSSRGVTMHAIDQIDKEIENEWDPYRDEWEREWKIQHTSSNSSSERDAAQTEVNAKDVIDDDNAMREIHSIPQDASPST